MTKINSICSVDECDKILTGRGEGLGMCSNHYQRFKKWVDTEAVKCVGSYSGIKCKVENCNQEAKVNYLCGPHYERSRKGIPLDFDGMGKKQRWVNRYVSHDKDECLIWPFSVSDHGRGTVALNGKAISAPRAMCILAHGQPPTPRHHAAHKCGNGHLGCMNPKHLTWKTPKENEKDKVQHGTLRKGRDINTNKLTEAQVLQIRADNGKTAGVDLARKYRVTPANISAIRKRKNWAWLE